MCVQGVLTNQDSVKTAAGNGLVVSAGVIFRCLKLLPVRGTEKKFGSAPRRKCSHKHKAVGADLGARQ